MLGHGSSKEEIEKLVMDLINIIKEKEVVRDYFCFSDVAVVKCKGLRKNENRMISISLDRGNCGWTYIFRLTHKLEEEEDLIVEDKGMKLVLKNSDVDKLKGAVIDYVDGLQEARFKILNPKVKGTCGCGKSVAL